MEAMHPATSSRRRGRARATQPAMKWFIRQPLLGAAGTRQRASVARSLRRNARRLLRRLRLRAASRSARSGCRRDETYARARPSRGSSAMMVYPAWRQRSSSSESALTTSAGWALRAGRNSPSTPRWIFTSASRTSSRRAWRAPAALAPPEARARRCRSSSPRSRRRPASRAERGRSPGCARAESTGPAPAGVISRSACFARRFAGWLGSSRSRS